MKSNKGITITSLVIYVMSFFTIAAIIATITTFFYSNNNYLKGEADVSADFDILNIYLLKEFKNKNTMPDIEDEGNTVHFKNGDIYKFIIEENSEYGKIFFENMYNGKMFELCNHVEKIGEQNIFEIENNKILKLNIQLDDKEYNQEYMFNN